jgi:hypothetical protein
MTLAISLNGFISVSVCLAEFGADSELLPDAEIMSLVFKICKRKIFNLFLNQIAIEMRRQKYGKLHGFETYQLSVRGYYFRFEI